MAIEKIYLDPDAQAYADLADLDSVAAAKLAGIEESADANVGEEFSVAEQTKLTGIADGAEVNPADLAALDSAQDTKLNGIEDGAKDDQTAAEVRDAIVGLADDDREILISRPTTGQKKIYAVQTHTDGKQEIEQSDTAES